MSEVKLALEVRKLELEAAKLALDARYVPLQFIAQSLNTACISIIALVVFYFFQWPQVGQAELTRLDQAKRSEDQILVGILGITDKQQRTLAIRAFSRRHPENPEIAILLESDRAVVASLETLGSIDPVPSESPSSSDIVGDDIIKVIPFCDLSVVELSDLRASQKALETRLEDERLGRNNNRPGFGPIAVAIQKQLLSVVESANKLQAARNSKGCK